ncbi:MAG TPA: hypothetical protein DHV05_09075, partial [Acholeplasmataceae bacterium]|nr:hypothetical protein [Acholeplasmataceae bacterium]
MKKLVIILLSLGILLITYIIVDVIVSSMNQDTLSFNQSLSDELDFSDLAYYAESDYYQYTSSFDELYPQVENILIEGHDFSDATEPVDILTSYEGKDHVLLTSDEGKTTWQVQIDEPGFYNIKLSY